MKSKLLGISMLTITCLYGMLAGVIILIVKLLGGEILFAITAGIIILVIQFLIFASDKLLFASVQDTTKDLDVFESNIPSAFFLLTL